jgi:hypothetical protein
MNVSFPDIEAVKDVGASFSLQDVGSLDFGLLANHKKLGPTPPRGPSPMTELKMDDIEVVNLDDAGPSIKLNSGPSLPSLSTSAQDDGIKILRDTNSVFPKPVPIAPAEPAAAPTRSWFSGASSDLPKEPAAPSAFSSWFGGGSSTPAATTEAISPPKTILTPEEEFTKKAEGLVLLERMDRKGVTGNKLTVANSLDEINAEIARRKDSRALEASVRFQRNLLTTVTTGMEFLNTRYDPVGAKLDGWSESVNENIEDYDEIFEELYDKYKDKSKVAPEVRLIMSLGLSAAMCHVTNTMFKSRMPGMDDILRNNPELRKQFATAAASQTVGPGFANFVNMGMGGRGAPVAPAAPSSFDNGFSGAPSFDAGLPPRGPPAATARREMMGPRGNNVDDILRSLDVAGEGVPNRSVPPIAPTPPSLNIRSDDVQSVHSYQSGLTANTERRKGGMKKASTVQPVGSTLTLNV